MTKTNTTTSIQNPPLNLATLLNPGPLLPLNQIWQQHIDDFLHNKKLHKTLLTLANPYSIGGTFGALSILDRFGPLPLTTLALPIVYSVIDNGQAWMNNSKSLGEAALGVGRDVGVTALSHAGGMTAGYVGFLAGSVLCLSLGIGSIWPALLLSGAARIGTTYVISNHLSK